MQNVNKIRKENPKKAQTTLFELCHKSDEEPGRESRDEYESGQKSVLDEPAEDVKILLKRFTRMMENWKHMNCIFRTGWKAFAEI